MIPELQKNFTFIAVQQNEEEAEYRHEAGNNDDETTTTLCCGVLLELKFPGAGAPLSLFNVVLYTCLSLYRRLSLYTF